MRSLSIVLAAGLALSGCSPDAPASSPPQTSGVLAPATNAGSPPAPRASASTPRPEPPGHDDHPLPLPAAPAGAAPRAAAAFARAWVRRDLSPAAWRTGITALCDRRFAAQLATVDPANLPADRVTGAPRAVRAPHDRSARYTVATNGGVLTVVLVDQAGRWVVINNDFTKAGT